MMSTQMNVNAKTVVRYVDLIQNQVKLIVNNVLQDITTFIKENVWINAQKILT